MTAGRPVLASECACGGGVMKRREFIVLFAQLPQIVLVAAVAVIE